MSPVTIVGLVMGGLLITAAIGIAWSKREFSAGTVTVTLVGVVLIGLSQWTTIKIKAGDVTVDLSTLKAQLKETAAALDQVATQTKIAIVATETTSQQVNLLAQSLGDNHVLNPATIRPLREKLEKMPRPDVTKLDAVGARLRRVVSQPLR